MKNICFILLASMSVGCAKNPFDFHSPEVRIHSDFTKYVTQFQETSKEVGRSVVISDLIMGYDSSLGGPDSSGNVTLGYCRTGDGTPEIMVNPKYWAYMSVSDKEELMFHELGHCVLRRGHKGDKVVAKDNYGRQIPVSIMYPYHLGAGIYGSNYNYYMSELFGNSPTADLYASAPTQFDGNVYASTMSEIEIHASKATVSLNEETNELDITQMGCGHEEGESHE